jgi:hypothetical protein
MVALMRVHPAKRRFLRQYPAPPPTPEGMVWMNDYLYPAKDVHNDCVRRMGRHDAMLERNRLAHQPRDGQQ